MENTAPVREMTGSVYPGENPTNAVMKGQIVLSNSGERQEIRFDRAVAGKIWSFRVVSLYNRTDGFPPMAAALAEVEFWYRGNPYKIANLGTVASNYLDFIRDDKVRAVREAASTVRNAFFYDDFDRFLALLKARSVSMDRIDFIRSRNKPVELRLQMTEANIVTPFASVMCGTIQAGRRSGQVLVTQDTDRGRKTYRFSGAVDIAEWMLDGGGNLHIRVGNGPWMMETGPLLSFMGTELDGLVMKKQSDFK